MVKKTFFIRTYFHILLLTLIIRWCPGTPLNNGKNIAFGKGNNCAAIRMRNEYGSQYSGVCIFDYPCTSAFRYTCESGDPPKTTTSVAKTTQASSLVCPSLFLKLSNFNQKCYYNQVMDKIPVQNFANAQKSCEDKNSNLIVIKSDDEFNALGELYGFLKGFTWIGLKYQDNITPMKWKWLDGTEINSTNKWWCPNSPANTGKNNVWRKGNVITKFEIIFF